MNLVLIEGLGKKDTIQKYLGSDYVVFPTMGHIRDLPEKSLSIDLENNFEPTYAIMPDKEKVVKNLLVQAKKADKIYLATDPDREGEAISWHLAYILNLSKEEKCRIAFNEISKKAIMEAIKSPREIDENLVNAQQARRVLDRLVGYIISPLLWKGRNTKNLSAGRVQSVALKLICDREREILNFKPEEYWNVNALLSSKLPPEFKAQLWGYKGNKVSFKNEDKINKLKEFLNGYPFVVKEVKNQETKSKAPAPFITSTLQQDAINKLGFKLNRVTQLAQSLYEGVEIKGEGKVALITYIRTDSTRISDSAKFAAKDYIIKNFGEEYAPKYFNKFKQNEDAQDAHEAIRPITLERKPEDLKGKIDDDFYKLYKLIYERFLASQMSDALYDSVSCEIECREFNFKATGRTTKFMGYTKLYKSEEDANKVAKLPVLTEGEILQLKDLICEQKFTKPSPRFTEASLIKQLEENGVGRPATYASIIKVIYDRKYIENKGKTKFITPTDLGFEVNDFLQKYFDKIVDVDFTAKFETKLDKIADNEDVWQSVIKEFYDEMMPHVEAAQTDMKSNKLEPVKTNIKCDLCGKYMNLIDGKYGKFLSCSGYPDCKSIKSYDVVVAKCPKCGGDVLEKHSKTQKIFYGCKNYPNCDYVSWDKPMNIKCPRCQGMIMERKSRAGKIFYSCENVLECKFVVYNKPVKEPCPKCGELMVEKITETSTAKVCTKCNHKIENISTKPVSKNTEYKSKTMPSSGYEMACLNVGKDNKNKDK